MKSWCAWVCVCVMDQWCSGCVFFGCSAGGCGVRSDESATYWISLVQHRDRWWGPGGRLWRGHRHQQSERSRFSLEFTRQASIWSVSRASCASCLCFSAEPIRSEGASQDRNVSLCLSQIEFSLVRITADCICCLCFLLRSLSCRRERKESEGSRGLQDPPLHTHQENQGPGARRDRLENQDETAGLWVNQNTISNNHHFCLVFIVTWKATLFITYSTVQKGSGLMNIFERKIQKKM